MTVLTDVANAIVSVGQQISDFTSFGVYNLLSQFTAWFIKWYLVAWYKAKLTALMFSYSVAQELITSLNLSDYLDSAWGSLESRTASTLAFFRIPEAVNMILSAAVTKFVFRFLGF
ncbi:MAG TPA: DUF2523 family protein [Methylobacter sp.]|jgi:hypothetical protein